MKYSELWNLSRSAALNGDAEVTVFLHAPTIPQTFEATCLLAEPSITRDQRTEYIHMMNIIRSAREGKRGLWM